MDDMNYNTPYVERPDSGNNTYISGRKNNENVMARVAFVLGIIAMVSVFTFTIYPTLILGSLAIICGILSRGYEVKLKGSAATGVGFGIGAIALCVALIVFVVTLIFSDGPIKKQMNEACKEVYGQTFDDMIKDAMDGSLDLDYNVDTSTFPYMNM